MSEPAEDPGAADLAIGLGAVIIAAPAGEPLVVAIDTDDGPALPAGPFRPERHRTLEEALRGSVEERTGLALGHVEQLYTFADRYRDPRELSGGPRLVSIGYLAFVRRPSRRRPATASWRPLYDLLPWEDARSGPPPVLETIRARLVAWLEAAPDPSVRLARRERAATSFGITHGSWSPVPALERYELLYEAEMAPESARDGWERAIQAARALGADPGAAPPRIEADFGPPMRMDHRRILATALGRLRAQLAFRPLVFELLPDAFPLSRLQTVVEGLAGVRLHTQNFRRQVLGVGLVEETGRVRPGTGGRPAALYRFRRDVLRERPMFGLNFPFARR